MACTNCGKVNNTCGSTIYSPCIKFEVPDDLQECVGAECMTAHESFVDLYERLCKVEEATDITSFKNECIEVEEESTILEVFEALGDKICEIDENLNICNILNQEIKECDIELTCLLGLDNCGEQVVINTTKELLQVLINKICALEEEVQTLKES